MGEPTPEPINCPFYGRRAVVLPGHPEAPGAFLLYLLSTEGNQCGLRTTGCAPCEPALAGRPVDWRTCGWVDARSVRLGSR